MNISITKIILLLAFVPNLLFSQGVENYVMGMNNTLRMDFVSEILPLSVSEDPIHGTYVVTSEPNGNFPNGLWHIDYTPDQNYLGPDTMVILLEHPLFPTITSKTLAISVVPDNVIARNDFFTMSPGTTEILDVLGNDEGTSAPYLEVVSLSNNLQVSIVGTQVEATIEPDYTGIAKFSYTTCVEADVCDIAIVSVFVESSAVIDTVHIGTNKEQYKMLLSPLTGGFDIPNAPNHGFVDNFGDGSFHYTPDMVFTGKDTFTLAYDINTSARLRTFVIDVFDTNPPTTFAIPDQEEVHIGGTIDVDVLQNDLGVNLILQNIDQYPLNGTATVLNDKINYQANAGFEGVEHIRYKVCTPQFDCQITDLYIFVDNQFPANNEFEISAVENNDKVIDYQSTLTNWSFVLNNSSTSNGGTVVYHPGQWSGTVNGQVVDGYNLLVYSPPTNFVGEDDFQIDYCYDNDCVSVTLDVDVIKDPNPNIDPHCSFDCVWPGDADANGIVDANDVLSIGYCLGEVGPARTNPDINWYGQHATDWAINIPGSTINLKHIDADGDGKIMEEDKLMVNSYLTFENSVVVDPNPATVDYPIYFVNTTPNPGPGDHVFIDILLGAEPTPAIDVSGISFTLFYNQEIVEDGTFNINFYQDSWLSYDCPVMDFSQVPFKGRADAAYTRVEGTMASGYGIVGTLDFIIEDEIDGIRQGDLLELNIDFKSAGAMNGAGELFTVAGEGISIPIDLSNGEEDLNPDDLIIYPNPTQGELNIHLNKSNNFRSIEIVDVSGRTIFVQEDQSNHILLNVQDFQDGLYFLRATTEKGFMTKKFQVFSRGF